MKSEGALGLDFKALVENLTSSRAKEASAWLKTLRSQAFRSFECLPLPTRQDEEWRYTEVSDIDLGNYKTYLDEDPTIQSLSSLPPSLAEWKARGDSESLRIQTDQFGTFQETKDAQPQGVILSSLESALQREEVLQKILTTFPQELGKFGALHKACWQGGAFVKIPRGVTLTRPIHSCFAATTPNSALFPYTVILVEEGANAIFIDEYFSTPEATKLFSTAIAHIILEAGATLHYFNIQRWGEGTNHFYSQTAEVNHGAILNNWTVSLGGRLTKAYVGASLLGEGATSYLNGILFGSKKQHFDLHTLQDHRAHHTVSDLLFKTALKDQARSVYRGLIRVEKSAQKTDAYQSNRNLLLNAGAKANSIPKLEIEADDVRCTHGATVGNVDEDQCFYLMSRGLSRDEAVQMIVQGFFEQVLAKVPEVRLRDRLSSYVDLKLKGAL